jgi:predicted ATPase
VLGRQPEDELVERIQRLSDGNPLFAEELLAASLRRGSESALPPKLRDLLAARLAQVPERILEVLRIAAASGRSVDEQLLAGIGGLDEDDVGDAVRHALDDHILLPSDRPGDAGYRFRHEIMRELVASQLLPDQARRIHAAYAEVLVEVPPARRSLTEIAQPWDAAGEVDRALAAHIEAGQVSPRDRPTPAM